MQDTYKVTSAPDAEPGLALRIALAYTEIHNRQTLLIPGRQSTVIPERARWACSIRATREFPQGLIPTFKKGICAARRHCVGPDRKRASGW